MENIESKLTKSQKLLYEIIKELGGSVGDKVKLAKLEYFSDFIHFAFNDTPISEITSLYEKRTYGPLSRAFNTDLVALIDLKVLKQTNSYSYNVLATQDSGLTNDEKKTVRYVVNKYKNNTWKELVEISHEQIPYIASVEGGIVEYATSYNLVDDYADYVQG